MWMNSGLPASDCEAHAVVRKPLDKCFIHMLREAGPFTSAHKKYSPLVTAK